MLSAEIITMSHKPPAWLDTGINYYCKLLTPYLKLNIANLPPVLSTLDKVQKQKKEADLISKKITPNKLIIMLDEGGKNYSSTEFAQTFKKWQLSHSTFTFILGPADGLGPEIKKNADQLLSLSNFTFTHDMALVILLEQLYRSITINNNHPYHRS
jgi:23S rRNA (pseudouridine1915-N3)-methyltransferase